MSISTTVMPPLTSAPYPAMTALVGERDQEIDIRQLRHHTKNSLQRIMALIAQAPGLTDTPEGERLARELEERIQLSADISDAMFGLTRDPGPMDQRLRRLAEALVALMRDPGQRIDVDVAVRGQCPPHLREPALRITNELVGNAVKHGLFARVSGRISIRLETRRGGAVRLTVMDDGCGIRAGARKGQGLSLARSIAEDHDGTIRLSNDCGTVAVADLR
jgi:two-component sensor histidine kinase